MGILRLLLALDVLAWHAPLYNGSQVIPLVPYSFIAVCTFFIISGFYMALVLNETYSSKPFGLIDFYVSRALRIYIPYWVVLSVIVCMFDFGFSKQFPIFPPDTTVPLLDQITWIARGAFILPHAFWETITFKPDNQLFLGQMYTVGLELLFYCIAPLIVRRSLLTLIALFLVSLFIHFLPAHLGFPARPWQYEFFPCILVFFITGALSYRLYARLQSMTFNKSWGWVALLVICGFAASGKLHDGIFTNAATPIVFYFLTALLIPFLFLASKTVKWDRFIGDLSYPLYILHIPVILMIENNPHAGILIPVWSVGLAVLLTLLVERPIESWRHSLSAKRWMERTGLSKLCT